MSAVGSIEELLTHPIAVQVESALAGALTQALAKAAQGASLEDSLMAAEETLADIRARAKFHDFKAGG